MNDSDDSKPSNTPSLPPDMELEPTRPGFPSPAAVASDDERPTELDPQNLHERAASTKIDNPPSDTLIEPPSALLPRKVLSGIPPGIRVRVFGRTDVGLVREHNEDNFIVADLTSADRTMGPIDKTIEVGPKGVLLSVCDGMGGALAGEIASQMAVDTLFSSMSEGTPPADRDSFAQRLVNAVEEAGRRIFGSAKSDRTRRGMGTTSTVVGLVDEVLFMGQVGDSRAYVLRKGEIKLVTRDQSLVNQLIESGDLTEDQAAAFEHNNIILQALGTDDKVDVDLTFLQLRQGDRVLVCSDGLSGFVHQDMMREVMSETADLTACAARLIEMANAGGGYDNITVIVADFEGNGLQPPTDDAMPSYQQYPLPALEARRNSRRSPPEPSRASAPSLPGPAPRKSTPRSRKISIVGLVAGAFLALLFLLLVALGTWWYLQKQEQAHGALQSPRAAPGLTLELNTPSKQTA